MINKAEIKKYLDKRYSTPDRTCPFRVISKTSDECISLCGQIFPKWKSQVERYCDIFDCPCMYLNCSYVVRKFRKWLNE